MATYAKYEESLEAYRRQVELTKLRLEAKYGPSIKKKWARKK